MGGDGQHPPDPAHYPPCPFAVAVSLVQSLQSPTVFNHIGVTFFEIMAGFAIGAGTGLILGVLVSQFPLVESTLYPYIVASRPAQVAIAPIIVIWFGYGIESRSSSRNHRVLPAAGQYHRGLRAIQTEQMELMVAFTASRWQIFRMIKVPQALPYIFVGLDVAIILSVIGAIVGEFVGSQAGLGYLILQRNFTMDMAGVFAVLMILVVMGVGLHYIVQLAQRRIVFWIEPETERIIGA